MKRNKILVAALVALSSCVMAPSFALSDAQVKGLQDTVAHVRLPELGAKSAELVKTASAQDQKDVALTVVKAIVTKHPGAAAVVVGSISKVAPELSPMVAAAAAELSPEQAAAIAKAAAAMAPAQAERIAFAVAQVARKSSRQVANAVMTAVPMSAGKVSALVTLAAPEIQGTLAVSPSRVANRPFFGSSPATSDALFQARSAANNPFNTIIFTSGSGQSIQDIGGSNGQGGTGGTSLTGGSTQQGNTSFGEDPDRDVYGVPH